MTDLDEIGLRTELESMPLWIVSAFHKFLKGDDYDKWSPQYLLMCKLIEKYLPKNSCRLGLVDKYKWIFVEVTLKCYENLNY